jgi:UDP:flavonoid glycosyltransferase YjiC (YdhE family)
VSDLLFVTWDGGGNVPPATAIAGELRARGHRARFLGHASQQAALEAAGVDIVRGRHARTFSSRRTSSPREMAATLTDPGLGRDLTEELDRRRPDLVVVDCLALGALEAARASGVPYVVLEHLSDDAYRGMLRGPLGVASRLRGQRPGRALAEARLRLVTTVPQLDRVRRDRGRPANLRHTGPVVAVGTPVPGEPTVLVSLSTFRFPGMTAAVQRILDATRHLGARVVLTSGPVVDVADLRLPNGVEVHGFVPHVEVMPHATMVVGHGGNGTTLQALAHDLPLVVMPMERHSDQPRVARSVQRAGAGRAVRNSDSPDRLAPVIAAMLADGPHREAAARLGRAIRARPGARLGADAVEEVLSRPAATPGRRGA